MKATYKKYTLDFIRPGGTSRGVMTQKETYFLILSEGGNCGIGECGLFRGLSADDRPDYKDKLQWVCDELEAGKTSLLHTLTEWPSIAFGLEQALRSLASEDAMVLFKSDFLQGAPIPINGLVWMGGKAYMQQQVGRLLDQGYRCLKFKIGALEFEEELELLRGLRNTYPVDALEIRVDANGAFAPQEAMAKLEALSMLEIHSIEQPIAAGQRREMARLCRETPLPIALDEELIGIHNTDTRKDLLRQIKPQYIILKPSLVGGYAACESWIDLARSQGIGWWITSALESNIGLNAIAQWTATLEADLPQGLGTGSLFSNNFASPLYTENGHLWYRSTKAWDIPLIDALCT